MRAARHHLLRILTMVMACGLAVATAACSHSEAGTPVPREPGSSGTGSETSAPSTGHVPRSLAEIDPCELLSSSDRAQFDVDEGQNDDVAGVPVCDWESEEFGITVGLHDDLGFKDANLKGTPVPIDVGKHDAYKVEKWGGGSGCVIFMIVTESSMAQLGGNTTDPHDTATACRVTTQLAQIIDPKLP